MKTWRYTIPAMISNPLSGPEHRTSQYCRFPLLVGCAIIAGLSCSRPGGVQDTGRLLARWFVTPTAARLDSLAVSSLSITDLREALQWVAGHTRGARGARSVRLEALDGGEYTLGYQTPGSFDRDSTYPLVVYLHGGIMNAADTKGERAFAMLSPLLDSMDLFLASPTATRECAWWTVAGVQRILQTVRYMTLHFPIDPDRVFLAGVSDGAAGCYAVANAANAPFAGFFAISGFGRIAGSQGTPLVPGNLMQRPIYNVNGSLDRLYPAAQVDAFLDALEKAGVGVERRMYEDQGHGFDYREREYGALLQRIRTWRRPSDRLGLSFRAVQGLPNIAHNLVTYQAVSNLSGVPALNAYWRNGRLFVRSIGVSEFVYEAPREDKPPVVVANGRAEERSRDVTAKVSAVLDYTQYACRLSEPRQALYAVTITTEP